MKKIIPALITIICIACTKKETLKNDSNFKLFIGSWINYSNLNKVSADFQTNGTIVLKRSMERDLKIVPTFVSLQESDYYITNGIYWTLYSFQDQSSSSGNIIGFYMNPTQDTITFPFKPINDFTYENTFLSSTYLTKK